MMKDTGEMIFSYRFAQLLVLVIRLQLLILLRMLRLSQLQLLIIQVLLRQPLIIQLPQQL